MSAILQGRGSAAMRGRTGRLLRWALPALLLSAGAATAWRARFQRHLIVAEKNIVLPADGRPHRAIHVWLSGNGHLRQTEIQVHAIEGTGARVVIEGDRAVVEVTSPVLPSSRTLTLRYRNQAIAVKLRYEPDESDSFGDGTPDFLRLHRAADRAAFRGWFAGLADAAAALPAEKLPREIDDCAALLRWAYRGALHAHDEAWLQGQPFEALPPLASVAQYVYPLTPLGAGLFRTRGGTYAAQDAADGTFAQFADAKTLFERNAFLVTRDVRAARPGDMLFYRQLEQNSPFHSMILTGTVDNWAVYHTGPIGKERGEIRRVVLDDLLRHPDRRWRPVPDNSNFLGVYRWNILREDGR